MSGRLTADAAAPLTAGEIAELDRDGEEDGECIMPVPAGAGPLPAIPKKKGTPDRRFEYRNANGQLLGHVLRWEARDGNRKGFWPVTFWRDGKGKQRWQFKHWPKPRPLFCLDLLANAPDAVVLLAEGEKSALAVQDGPFADAFTWARRPVVGICWPGGGKAVQYADFSPLAGREVIILPDNDKDGEEAADKLVGILHEVGVRRLQRWKPPAGAPEKWDIADPPPAGIEPGAIVESILAAAECSAPRVLKTLPEFLAGFVAPDYVVDGILRRGFLYSLTAMTGAGKTAIALLIAEIASNRKRRRRLGPHDVEHVRVVYIACENADDVRLRLIGMEALMGFDRSDLDLLIIDQVFDLEKNLDRIRKEVGEFGGNIGLVFIDTSAAMFQGDDDNNNIQALAHAKSQRKLCELPGRPCVVPLVHPTKHVSKPDDLLPRGGGAYLNEVDGNLTAWTHDDRMTRLSSAGKFRGPDFEPIEFQMSVITTSRLTDSKGRMIPTVMAKVLNDEAIAEAEEKATFQNTRLLSAMAARPDGSIAQWARDCGWLLTAEPDVERKPNKSLTHRVLTRLTENGHVKKTGTVYSLTPAGKKAGQDARKTAPQAVPEGVER